MKGQFTFLKMSLVGLFLIAAMGVSAQVTPETPTVTFLCNGATVQLTAPTGYTNYQWYFDANGSTTPAVAIGTSDGQVYTATETGYYYVEVWNGGDGCKSPLSEAYPIYILPALSVSIAADGGDNGYCVDESATGITLTATVDNPTPMPTGLGVTFQWFVSEDNSGTNRQPVSGATAATYNVIQADAGNYFYDVVATYNVTVVGGADACDATSDVQEVIVSPLPEQPTITIVSTP